MSIGAGILLIVIGAVLTFALNGDLGAGVIDLTLVGYILMAAGLVVTLVGMVVLFKKRKTVSSTVVQDRNGAEVTRQDTINASPNPPQF